MAKRIYQVVYIVVAITLLLMWQLNPSGTLLSKIGGVGVGLCIILTGTKYAPFKINKKKSNVDKNM